MPGKLQLIVAHALLASLLLGTGWVHAQSPSADSSRVELSEVVVTGTRIEGALPTSPVITIGRPQIDESGYGSIGELLLAIPQNFSGGQNPGVIGARGNNQFTISGAYSPNLHGLGADSTLTLIDGHRFAYDGYQNGVDLSVVPLAAIARVDILTDGASAIYGSDAVAGVVNVVLKQHYDGLTADARYGDVTSGHSAQEQYSLLGGHDWSGGNALLSYEYAHSDPLGASDRAFSAGAAQPTWLLPELNRNSAFARVRQKLWDAATASVEALYTARSDVGIVTTGTSINYAETTVRQYSVSPSLDVDLPAGWLLGVDGTFSHDADTEATPTVDAMSGRLTRSDSVSYENDLRLVEVHGSGPLLRLPSGPLELAVGGGYRDERFRNVEPPGSTVPSADASRHVEFAYAEMQIPLISPDAELPLLRRLELNAAFRYERYTDFGGQSTPKFGIVYVPDGYLRVRASWSKSFRAPEFVDVVGPRQLYLFPAALFGGTVGTTALLVNGANPALGPETAESTTAGFDVLWPGRPSFAITPTYFHIDYADRVVQPVDNIRRGLSSPLYAPFVARDPSVTEQQALVAQASYFRNFSGGPYDPTNVSAVLDDSDQNATTERIDGVDLTARNAWPMLGGELGVLASGTWLRIVQRTIPAAPAIQISGMVFNPPKFKSRVSATWRCAGWSLGATFNYVGSESDNSGTVVIPVSSWSTVDAQLSYTFPASTRGVLRGVRASLSVHNMLDRDPPHLAATSTVYPGLSYDSANASALGRVVNAHIAKSW